MRNIESKRRKRMLIVDDSRDVYNLVHTALEDEDYEITFAANVATANTMVLDSIVTGRRFDIALIDWEIGKDRGDEFAHRLRNILVDTMVIIITSHFDLVADARDMADGILIKTANWLKKPDSLVGALNRVLMEKRENSFPEILQANRWNITGEMGQGILSLKLITEEVGGEGDDFVEKYVSLKKNDGQRPDEWVSTVVYTGQPKSVFPISVASNIGCKYGCRFCRHSYTHTTSDGRPVAYVGQLTVAEIVSQVYYAVTRSMKLRDLLEGHVKGELHINFTAEGDWSDNVENCAGAIRQLAKVKEPAFHFTLTSVGRVDALKSYINRHLDLLRTRHYWSVNSVDPKIRGTLMPGTHGHNLEEIRGLYQEIADKTKMPVTASFAIFSGVNDGDDEVQRIAAFFKDWPSVRIKVMAGCPGSLTGVRDITIDEVLAFKDKLVSAGLKNVRHRFIFGTSQSAGCGSTAGDFIQLSMPKPRWPRKNQNV